MPNRQTLSQYKLADFLACQRRFQLKTLRHLPWPASPLSARQEASVQEGQAFHQLLERHFLGLSISTETIPNSRVRHWWQTFKAHSPVQNLPENARFLPETGLTVPLGNHLLYGRFDLLVVGQDSEKQPFAHVFDWKTGRPIEATELNGRWQTRLYLALLAEGGSAFWPENVQLVPENVRLTYWFVQEADAPVTINYSQAEHRANWTNLRHIATQLDDAFAQGSWPQTEAWSHCRECAYQVYCGRQSAGAAIPALEDSEELPPLSERLLTPELP